MNLRHEDKFLNYLYDTTRLWYKTYQRNVVMHDPLALYYVCDPSLFETTQYNISVIQEGSLTAALTMPLEKIYRKQISPDSEFYSVTNCAVSANYKKFMRILRKELEF